MTTDHCIYEKQHLSSYQHVCVENKLHGESLKHPGVQHPSIRYITLKYQELNTIQQINTKVRDISF